MNAIHPMQTGTGFRPNNKKVIKKKINPMKGSKVVDYLDPKFLLRFTNDQGKILPRRITGINAYQQRELAVAIKHARHLAIIPFVALDIT
jgi:small subunit ribosomal protein S18